MGESALKLQSKSEKHKQNTQSFDFGSSAGGHVLARNKEACVEAGTLTCFSGNMEVWVGGSCIASTTTFIHTIQVEEKKRRKNKYRKQNNRRYKIIYTILN